MPELESTTTETTASATSAGTLGAPESQGADTTAAPAADTSAATTGAEEKGGEAAAKPAGEESQTPADPSEETTPPAGTETTAAERKVTAGDRVSEALTEAKAAKERVAQLEAQLQAQTEKQAPPPFAPDEMVQQVKDRMVDAVARKRAIETEMELNPEGVDRAMLQEYSNIEEFLQKARHGLAENERVKQEYLQKQQETQKQEQYTAFINTKIGEASKLVMESRKIPADVFQQGQEWFDAQRKADPVLDMKYRELVMNKGPAHAVDWAVEYCTEHMGKEAKQALQQQEAAKQTTVGSAAAGGAAITTGAPSVWDMSKDDFEAQVRRVKGLE